MLDLVLTSHPHLVKNIVVGPPIGSSDHSCFTFRLDSFVRNAEYRLIRAFSKANYDLICEFLLTLDWRSLLEKYSSVNDKYEFLYPLFITALNNSFPYKKFRQNLANFH